ncbi:MAG: uroporphyrinogen decarboxylase family protein [Candidatus Helarchaeota archaeon]
MKPKDRILTTLNHEEPDRVPIFDLGVDSVPVLKKYGGKSLGSIIGLVRLIRILVPFGWKRLIGWFANRPFAYKAAMKSVTNFMKKIGYDATFCPVSLFFTKSAFPSTHEYVDEYGRRFRVSKAESGGEAIDLPYYQGGYFDTENPEASYEAWGSLDPDHPSRMAAYRTSLKVAKDEIYVIPAMIGPLEGTWESFGFTTFTKLLFKNPQFIEKVFRDRGDFMVALTENLLDEGAETILILDDAGYKGSPFLSPKMYEKFVASQIKRVTEKVHAANGKVLLHSCGNLNKLLEAIIAAGVDGVHPWESSAGMDIFSAKEGYGKRLTLIGNVPIDLLTHGTLLEVENYVKRLLYTCAPGGGYILSTGHSVSYSVGLENYEKMLEIGWKYGTYPISIHT